MTNDIKGLEIWEGETKEWNKRVGDLKTSAGSGMIDALENWYGQFLTKPTDRNRRETLLWRLRLHLKFNHDHEFLQELDEVFTIGLVDENVGPTYWDIEPQRSVEHRQPFNWRRDSGDALRGSRAIKKTRDLHEEVAEPNE